MSRVLCSCECLDEVMTDLEPGQRTISMARLRISPPPHLTLLSIISASTSTSTSTSTFTFIPGIVQHGEDVGKCTLMLNARTTATAGCGS